MTLGLLLAVLLQAAPAAKGQAPAARIAISSE